MFHYTYRISNIKLHKHYYGVRSSKVEPKKDLGIKYFSSSKDKEFMRDQKENPHNYKYKVIFVYKTRKEAINSEIKFHNKFDVGVNESFYNRAKQASTGFDTTGTSWNMSENGKNNIRKSLFERGGHKGENNPRHGAKLSKETKNKISNTLLNNDYVDSEETKKKKSESAKNRPPMSKDTRDKISKIHKNKKVKQETIDKMIATKKERSYGPNYNSLMVNIYDNDMNLIFECYGDFNKICLENNLPQSALRNSLKTNKSIYQNLNGGNLAKVTKNGMIKYKGWIAKYR